MSAEVPPDPEPDWEGGGGARSTRWITLPPTSETTIENHVYILYKYDVVEFKFHIFLLCIDKRM